MTSDPAPAWGRSLFVWSSWLPLAAFLATNLYVNRLEGWGQWAAAPMLLGPVLLSAAFVATGGVIIVREKRRSGVRASSAVASALASVPCLWLVWRLMVTM